MGKWRRDRRLGCRAKSENVLFATKKNFVDFFWLKKQIIGRRKGVRLSDEGLRCREPPVCFNIWHSYLNISPYPNLPLYQITDTRPFL